MAKKKQDYVEITLRIKKGSNRVRPKKQVEILKIYDPESGIKMKLDPENNSTCDITVNESRNVDMGPYYFGGERVHPKQSKTWLTEISIDISSIGRQLSHILDKQSSKE